jgi:hypothetical protein
MSREIEKRVKQIVSHTIQDFYNSGSNTTESPKSLKQWLSTDLLLLEDIEEYSTIEISILTLEKLQSVDLINIEMINEVIARSLINSENEIIHVSIPKVL